MAQCSVEAQGQLYLYLLPLSSVEVNNAWSFTSTHPFVLMAWDLR